jgi:hypothetical protein
MRIGRYITKANAKECYSNECNDVRAWPGFNVVLDSMVRNGYEYEPCCEDTVHEYDVVLYSITGACDWWQIIKERLSWRKGNYTSIIGGPGVLNVMPFLRFFDCFVFGRGELLILDILKEMKNGDRYIHESLCWSKDFNINNKYVINQTGIYDNDVMLDSGTKYHECSIGCENKCFFCGYTWHRLNQGGMQKDNSGMVAFVSGSIERTMFDLSALEYNKWEIESQVRITALDGCSERIRFAINKKITNDMYKYFLKGIASQETMHNCKIYCIVGYPIERDADLFEMLQCVKDVDSKLETYEKQVMLTYHFTPFRPMPSTPLACWPTKKQNYRQQISKLLKSPHNPGNMFYQGNSISCVESMGVDSLSTVMLDMISHRGDESHTDLVASLASNKKFWSASALAKEKTLEKYCDMDTLFGRYEPEALPTRYLHTYCDVYKLMRVANRRLDKESSNGA